ncbi:MAG: hypothetical protein ACE5LQ_03020 [Candidatus Bipolaricaulia bacterium]
MKEFRVAVPNRPGGLRELLEYLAEKGINLKSVASLPVAERAVVALVPYNPDLTRKSLQERGIEFEEADLLFVDLLDEPGQLVKVARIVADAGANIESIYLLGKVGRGECCRVQFGLRFDDLEKARAALRASEEWAPWVGVGGEG